MYSNVQRTDKQTYSTKFTRIDVRLKYSLRINHITFLPIALRSPNASLSHSNKLCETACVIRKNFFLPRNFRLLPHLRIYQNNNGYNSCFIWSAREI